MSRLIIDNDEFSAYEDKSISKYVIEFKEKNTEIIESLLQKYDNKHNILLGMTIYDDYNKISFKATHICTLDKVKQKCDYYFMLNLIYYLTNQLKYLITKHDKCFLSFDPKKILIINNNISVFLSNNNLVTINENNKDEITIDKPFEKNSFISPELYKIKILPYNIHYKVIYYSLGLILLDCLNVEDIKHEINIDNINNNNKIINDIDKYNQKTFYQYLKKIENTKLYFFIINSLNKNIHERSLIFI